MCVFLCMCMYVCVCVCVYEWHFFVAPLIPGFSRLQAHVEVMSHCMLPRKEDKEYVNKTHFSENGDELGKDEVEDKTNATEILCSRNTCVKTKYFNPSGNI